MPIETLQIDFFSQSKQDRGAVLRSSLDRFNRPLVLDNSLGEQETGCECLVRSRRSHGDGDRLSHKYTVAAEREHDLEWLLDRHALKFGYRLRCRLAAVDTEFSDGGMH